MPQLNLEQRVTILEQKIADLQATAKNGAKPKPWLRTLGMFGNDDGMSEIFDEAMKLREKDRQRARRQYGKSKASRRGKK